MKERFLITCAALMISATASTYSIAADDSANSFGEAAQTADATRSITISPKTKSVNVKTGEIINFNVDGKTFVWNFDGKGTKSKFDMNMIAPTGMLNHNVTIYIDHVPPNES